MFNKLAHPYLVGSSRWRAVPRKRRNTFALVPRGEINEFLRHGSLPDRSPTRQIQRTWPQRPGSTAVRIRSAHFMNSKIGSLPKE